MTRAICTHWPDLDPVEVSAWPWHRTQFYIEWMESLAAQASEDADAEQHAAALAAVPDGAVGIEGLVGLPGVQVREVS